MLRLGRRDCKKIQNFMNIKNMNQVIKKRKLSDIDEGVPSYEYSGSPTHSTCPFDEKSDEIYDQHNDHSDAENMIIDRVNDDCLAEIFMYLAACERPKLALVCKRWKKALDNAWYDVKKLELTYWRWDEYPSFIYKYYPTSDGRFCFIKSLLNKCGRYLTKLDMTAYGRCNIVPVINELCPNLVTLRLRFTSLNQVILANSFTGLSKLKSLTIILQKLNNEENIPVNLIKSLRNVANTLTDLNLSNWINDITYIPNLTELIMDVVPDLKSLKRFESTGVGIRYEFSDYAVDNEILYFNFTVNRGEEYKKITKLNLMKNQVKNETLYTIANTFKHLRKLNIKSKWVTDDGVVAILKMNNLQNLKFFESNNITDSSVKLLKNLIKLKLPISNKITDDSVMEVLENSPKMKELDVSGTNVTAEFVKKAAEISKYREQRLFFYVSFIPDIRQYESPYFEIYIIHEEIKNNNILK